LGMRGRKKGKKQTGGKQEEKVRQFETSSWESYVHAKEGGKQLKRRGVWLKKGGGKEKETAIQSKKEPTQRLKKNPHFRGKK